MLEAFLGNPDMKCLCCSRSRTRFPILTQCFMLEIYRSLKDEAGGDTDSGSSDMESAPQVAKGAARQIQGSKKCHNDARHSADRQSRVEGTPGPLVSKAVMVTPVSATSASQPIPELFDSSSLDVLDAHLVPGPSCHTNTPATIKAPASGSENTASFTLLTSDCFDAPDFQDSGTSCMLRGGIAIVSLYHCDLDDGNSATAGMRNDLAHGEEFHPVSHSPSAVPQRTPANPAKRTLESPKPFPKRPNLGRSFPLPNRTPINRPGGAGASDDEAPAVQAPAGNHRRRKLLSSRAPRGNSVPSQTS
jgi:hypothetical protein